MTLQEIQDLAGHRDVPPWVVKLVGDAVAKEREACALIYDEIGESPAMFATMNEYDAFKKGALKYSVRILARGQA